MTLATDGLLGGQWTVDLQRSVHQRSAKSGLCCFLAQKRQHHFRRRSFGASLPDEVGLASCRRQPCVPGCFSGHCDLAKPALRPPMFFRRLASNFSSDCLSLSALVSAANLSTTLFLDGLCFPGASRTGLRQQTGLCEEKTGHRR